MSITLVEVYDFINNAKNPDEVYSVYKACQSKITGTVQKDAFIEQAKELRFSGDICCPHCKGSKIRHYGHYNGNQRYQCKDCGKTFTNTTNSPIDFTRKDIQKWLLYIRCMIEGYSIRKTAIKVGIHRNTAFYWRHKILNSLGNADTNDLTGIIEADETFFLESFKGNHKKKGFPVPRKPRKRGGKASHRGISEEQVCVLCAIDRSNDTINRVACKGRIGYEQIDSILGASAKQGTVLCTDGHRSYIQFAKENGFALYQFEGGKGKQDIYHIQHVNSWHSRLKKWIKRFNGVSTKYLNFYLVWFRWLEKTKSQETYIRTNNLLLQTFKNPTKLDIKDFRNISPCYVA
jgi:transposase-like protein